jgi:amino acid transporter
MEKVGSETQSKQETRANKTGLKRDLGLFTFDAIGVGSIIGSGMFAMPAVMGSVTGSALLLAVVLTGIVTTAL